MPALAPYLTPAERGALRASFPHRPGITAATATTRCDAVAQLHAAGVPILAGSDAPNPGHGARRHDPSRARAAGEGRSDAAAALAAATATPGARVRPHGPRPYRAGPARRPASSSTAIRRPTSPRRARSSPSGRGASRLDRQPAPTETDAPQRATTTGTISDFDGASRRGVRRGLADLDRHDDGWQVRSEDGARSREAPGSAGALEITGTIKAGRRSRGPARCSSRSQPPMAPADLSKFTEIVFDARGDGREYQLMVFATRLGNIPAAFAFTAGPEWQESGRADLVLRHRRHGPARHPVLGHREGAFRFVDRRRPLRLR